MNPDAPNRYEKNYSSYTDRINLRMENFHFFHRSSTSGHIDPKYNSPVNPFHQFYNWLKHNEADSATYLITGYRGAGKTSFVNYTIDKLNADRRKGENRFVTVSVSLGQEKLEEIDVLRIIAKKLLETLYGLRMSMLALIASLLNFFSMACYLAAVVTLVKLPFSQSIQIDHSAHFCFPLAESGGEWELLSSDWRLPLFSLLAGLALNLLNYLFKRASRSLRAYNRLKKLCRRLNSTISNEKSINLSSELGGLADAWKYSKKQNRVLPPASIQEIEYELISVLETLKGSLVNGKKRFVIIFDELDKVNPEQYFTPVHEQPEYEKLSVRPEQRVSSRTRKQQVLAVIANMKLFLSTAPAYFVFIAGREMYEAFQNDMSDRDFSINSLFNGVLNIDSFLSSARSQNNSALKTEEFVCRQLLPPDFAQRVKKSIYGDRSNIYSLKNYHTYRLRERKDYYPDENIDERLQRIHNEVMFLYRFIGYLSFISNGSPKKLTLFFEKYVRTKQYLTDIKKVVLPKEAEWDGEDGNNAFYLSWGYYSMQKINFIHYLTYPITQNLINRSNMYGDKLLVSASFLITHIFKLHNSGFSWRNLEQMPELQEINRTPEIREYISSVIHFMNHSYLTTISCGLFHYKFPMHIVEEISFHSKLSGEISALVNFSSDELYGIKKHYTELLLRNSPTDNTYPDSQYAQASIHHSLGDIYMLEENYSAAIREYECSIELVSPLFYQKRSSASGNGGTLQQKNHLLFLNRSMLKLGLAHEKRHTDNSAFTVYDELITLLKENAKSSVGRFLFTDTRTLHLALVAKLYVLEKIDTNGIRGFHIEKAIEDFAAMFLKSGNNLLVTADFYRKIGDILFYKNKQFDINPKHLVKSGTFDASRFYALSLITLLKTEGNLKAKGGIWQVLYDISSDSSLSKIRRDNYIYNIALACENLGHCHLYDDKKDNSEYSNINDFCNYIKQIINEKKLKITAPKNHFQRSMFCYWAATRLYNRSCERSQSIKCYSEMIYALILYLRSVSSSDAFRNSSEAVKSLLKCIVREAMIALYRQKEHIYQSEVNVLKWVESKEMYEHIQYGDLSSSPDVENIIYLYYTTLLELWEKDKNNTELKGTLISFFNSPLMTGKQSCHTLQTDINNLKLKAKFITVLLHDLLSVENLLDVDFTCLQKYIGNDKESLADQFCHKEKAHENKEEKNKELLEFLIAEGMFCLSRLVELLTPLRNTTLFNNLFKADAFYRLFCFAFLYKMLYCYYSYGNNPASNEKICRFLEQWGKQTLDFPTKDSERRLHLFRLIAKATRKSTPNHTDLTYLGESCLFYYARAEQVHNEGKTYQEVIRRLFFLDDDLNNDTMQFHLAVERREITQNETKTRRDFLKKYFKEEEDMYRAEYYFTEMK